MTQYDKLIPALIKAQGELKHAAKDSANPHFKSKYADLATVLDTCKPALQANGLAVTHQRESTDLGEFLITTLWHASGQHIISRSKLQPVKSDPQGFGSAMTYARRYDLSALIGLASDDDDGNAASKQENGHTAAPTTPKKSVFTNASLRNTYCENTLTAIQNSETLLELNEVFNINKPRLKEMRDSGNEHDAMAVEEICKQYEVKKALLHNEAMYQTQQRDMEVRQ